MLVLCSLEYSLSAFVNREIADIYFLTGLRPKNSLLGSWRKDLMQLKEALNLAGASESPLTFVFLSPFPKSWDHIYLSLCPTKMVLM